MEQVAIRAFTPDDAAAVATWSYEPPFDIYDGDPRDPSGFVAPDEEGYGYYAIEVAGELVGFCCFGAEARVAGQQADPGTLDIGGGVRPDLLSQRIATEVLPVVMDLGRLRFSPTTLRMAVASFNERATRLCLAAGFVVAREFDGPGRRFQELIRPADD